MRKNLIQIMLIGILSTFIWTATALADDTKEPLARSDFFSITQDDISLLRSRMSSFFQTTQGEYCRALLKINLFSKQAIEEKIDLEPEVAAELEQMVAQKLSDIYINRLLENYELLPGSISSYYDSHPEEFTLEDGTLMPLNEAVRKQIRAGILKHKKSVIANREMNRLMEKYQVEIIDPVCEKKDQSDE